MKWIVLCVLILILISVSFYYGFGLIKTGWYKGPVSDHFNGKLFFNPGVENKKSFSDILRWWFTVEKHKWPERANNLPHEAVVQNIPETAIRVTFVNHSTVLIQTHDVNFLFDPIWSYRASPFTWIGPARVRNPGITFEELPRIDVVLISHNHYDHLNIPTLLKLKEKFDPLFIVPLGNKYLLNQFGISNVIEMDWWQQYKMKSCTVTFLPSQHWSARWLHDRFRTLWGGYGIEIYNKKIYFAGDAGYSDHFNQIRMKWGVPDIVFLPIGSYLPRWFMKDNHLNPEESVKAHIDLQSKNTIGIHFGTFQLSEESINQPLIDLNAALHKYQVSAQNFYVLKEGESKNF